MYKLIGMLNFQTLIRVAEKAHRNIHRVAVNRSLLQQTLDSSLLSQKNPGDSCDTSSVGSQSPMKSHLKSLVSPASYLPDQPTQMWSNLHNYHEGLWMEVFKGMIPPLKLWVEDVLDWY